MGEYLVETNEHKITDGYLVAKGPPHEVIHNKSTIEMLNEEGSLAQRLDHQNIVKFYDMETDKDDLPLLLWNIYQDHLFQKVQ